jgi:hypothetical protein
MSPRKRLAISGCIGLTMSGLGLGLVQIGGYGPCGPASTLATVGSVLGYWHFVGLCILIPTLGEWFDTGLQPQWLCIAANFSAILVVPAINWSLLIFAGWAFYCRISRQRGTLAEPDAVPSGGLATQPADNSGVTEGPPSVS